MTELAQSIISSKYFSDQANSGIPHSIFALEAEYSDNV